MVNWNGFGLTPQAWTVIMLVTACFIELFMTLRRGDSGYLFVFVWSFAGIAFKQFSEPLVANTAWMAAFVAFGLAVFSPVQRRRTSS